MAEAIAEQTMTVWELQALGSRVSAKVLALNQDLNSVSSMHSTERNAGETHAWLILQELSKAGLVDLSAVREYAPTMEERVQ